MKKLFLILCMFAAANAWSQASIKISKDGKDTLIIIGQGSANDKQKSIDNMPNALQGKQDNLVYRGNNGQGFHLYQSSVDNMMVLKPDTNNAASLTQMPNALSRVAQSNPDLKMTYKESPSFKQQIIPEKKPKANSFKLEQLPLKN